MGKKCFDSVWCDMVSIDDCHILLGRPWQFDKSVVHDGKKNTYTLSIKGKYIVLALVREKMETKADGGRTCCLHHNLWRK